MVQEDLRGKPSTVDINFGVSQSPGTPYQENVIHVPFGGELPKIADQGFAARQGYRESAELKPVLNMFGDIPQVIFTIPSQGAGGSVEIMRLFWINERHEWVAVHEHSWWETSAGRDYEYEGPFIPDALCNQKILQAYGGMDQAASAERDFGIPPENASKMSPTRLSFLFTKLPME